MATSSSEDRFTIYVRKACQVGPYLNPSKVQSLPDFFQERSVNLTVKNVIEAIASTSYNIKEVFQKIPCGSRQSSSAETIEVCEKDKNGKAKIHHCKLQIMDRRSKGETVLSKFIENLKCCSEFLSQVQPKGRQACHECHKMLDSSLLKPKVPKTEPDIDKSKKSNEPCSELQSIPRTKNSFTVYCRRNCKAGAFLDPLKIQKLSTSFHGSFPNVIRELVPAIILCGYNPTQVMKKLPTCQGGSILIEVKIGKIKKMCLINLIDGHFKFWSFIRKLCQILGMCENFFSEKPPKKSCCKRCRSEEDGENSSDEEQFQEPKKFRVKTKAIKRKNTLNDYSYNKTPVKKLKTSERFCQNQCKELKVVIERLSQDTLDYYLKKNKQKTPNKKKLKQVYLGGKKVHVIVPEFNKSPCKILFPGELSLLSSSADIMDEETDNLLNTMQKDSQPQDETSEATVSMESDNDSSLLENFLNNHHQDPELISLKEIGENIEKTMTDKNPLVGLFQKSDIKDNEGEDNAGEKQESIEQYTSVLDSSQLYSQGSFFGDVFSFGEMDSSPVQGNVRIKSEVLEGVSSETSPRRTSVSTSDKPFDSGSRESCTSTDTLQDSPEETSLKVDSKSKEADESEETSSKSHEKEKESKKSDKSITSEQISEMDRNCVSRVLNFSTPEKNKAHSEDQQSEKAFTRTLNESPNRNNSSTPSTFISHDETSENINVYPQTSGNKSSTTENNYTITVSESVSIAFSGENQQTTSNIARSLNQSLSVNSLPGNFLSPVPVAPSFSNCGAVPTSASSLSQTNILPGYPSAVVKGVDAEFIARNSERLATPRNHSLPAGNAQLPSNTNLSSLADMVSHITTPNLRMLSVEEFSGCFDNLSHNSITSAQLTHLTGNLNVPAQYGINNMPTTGVPSVTLPANNSTNSSVPPRYCINNMPTAGVPSGTLPVNNSTNSSVPPRYCINNMPTTGVPSVTLPGNTSISSGFPAQYRLNNIPRTGVPSVSSSAIIRANPTLSNQQRMIGYGRHPYINLPIQNEQQRPSHETSQGVFLSRPINVVPPQPYQFTPLSSLVGKPSDVSEVHKAIEQARQIVFQRNSHANISVTLAGNQSVNVAGAGDFHLMQHQNITQCQPRQNFMNSYSGIGSSLPGLYFQNSPNSQRHPVDRQVPSLTTGQPVHLQRPVTKTPVQVTTARCNLPLSTGLSTHQRMSVTNQPSVQVTTARYSLPLPSGLSTIPPHPMTRSPLVQVPTTKNSPSLPSTNPPLQVTKTPPVQVQTTSGNLSLTSGLTTSVSVPTLQISQTLGTSALQAEAPAVSNNGNTNNNIVTETSRTVAGSLEHQQSKKEVKNPLKAIISTFFESCKSCPKNNQVMTKVKTMLITRRNRLAITQKDITDLEELVGNEIKGTSVFREMVKLLTGNPVLDIPNSGGNKGAENQSPGILQANEQSKQNNSNEMSILPSNNSGSFQSRSAVVRAQNAVVTKSLIASEGADLVTQSLVAQECETVTPFLVVSEGTSLVTRSLVAQEKESVTPSLGPELSFQISPNSQRLPVDKQFQSLTTGLPENPAQQTTRCYPPLTTGQPVHLQRPVTKTPVQVTTARCNLPLSAGLSTHQRMPVTNQPSVQVTTARYSLPLPSGLSTIPPHPMTRSPLVQVPTTKNSPSLPSTNPPLQVTKTPPVQVQTTSGNLSLTSGLTTSVSVPTLQISQTFGSSTLPAEAPPISSTSNINNNIVTETSRTVAGSLEHQQSKKEVKNPLKAIISTFFESCKSCPKKNQVMTKVNTMLITRRNRLAITQKDITDLEELVGNEIKGTSVFREMVKLLTGKPVLDISNSGGIKEAENQSPGILQANEQSKQNNSNEMSILSSNNSGSFQSRSAVVRAQNVTQSLIASEGTGLVTQSLVAQKGATVTPSFQKEEIRQIDKREVTLVDQNGSDTTMVSNRDQVVDVDQDDSISSNTNNNEDDDLVIIKQFSNTQSKRQSKDTTKSSRPSAASALAFDSTLPKPVVKVSKINEMTVLLWDLPEPRAHERIEAYELYAIQIETNKQLTKDMVRTMAWKKLGVVKALPPPMAITLTNLVPGLKSYVIVRAISVNNCSGPFSKLSEVKQF